MEEEYAAQHAFESAPIPGDNPWGVAVRLDVTFYRAGADNTLPPYCTGAYSGWPAGGGGAARAADA